MMSHRPLHGWRRSLWLWLGAATLFLVVADRWWQVPHGLEATYFAGPDWQPGPSTNTYVDPVPSSGFLAQRRPDPGAQRYSVEWRGFLLVPKAGAYTFSVTSDDGSALYLRGERIVDNPGRHGPNEVRGTVDLEAGVNPIFIRYFQDGGDATFMIRWSREGSPLALLQSSVLLTNPVSARWVLIRRLLDISVGIAGFAWCALLLATVWWLGEPLRTWAGEWRQRVDPLLVGVLAVSLALNLWAVWWALPNVRGWAPDELVPADVLQALDSRFSSGWYGKYPPLHYAVLSLAYAPVLFASWIAGFDVEAPGPYQVLFYLGRLVSVGCSAGIVLWIYACGRELYGRTGAALAALTAALMVPFVYYGKTANLEAPYLFWFSASLFLYIRIFKYHARADYVWFALCAALAVSTKDQAYGLFVLSPAIILLARWQAGRPLFDRTVMLAAATAMGTFVVADNLLFNLDGFVQHVKVIAGPASSDYQMFPATLRGHFDMLMAAGRELRIMFGWPLTSIVILALLGGLVQAPLRRLLIPAASYYLTFLSVVLYFYDRFLLPIGLVLALLAGAWLDRFLTRRAPLRPIRIALVASVFLYSVMYASAVDFTLVHDSRRIVSRWIKAHVRDGDIVAARGPLEYFLIAGGLNAASTESVDDIAAVRPAFVVLNVDHIESLPPGHATRAMRDYLLTEASSYQLALRYRATPMPLPGRHPDLGMNTRVPEISSLGQLNPPLEVFVRDDVAGRTVP